MIRLTRGLVLEHKARTCAQLMFASLPHRKSYRDEDSGTASSALRG